MQGLTVVCYGEIVAAGSPECQCVRERERVCVCVLRACRAVLHPATKLSPSPPPRRCTPTRSMAAVVRFPELSIWAEWRYSSFELRPETETEEAHVPANQDVTDCLPKLFGQSIVAVSVNEKKKKKLRFFKKSGKSFLKKRKVKKKSGIPPKSGRLTSLLIYQLAGWWLVA